MSPLVNVTIIINQPTTIHNIIKQDTDTKNLFERNDLLFPPLQVTSSPLIPSSTLMSCCWTFGTRRTASRSTPTTCRLSAPGRWRCLTSFATTIMAPFWTGRCLIPGLLLCIIPHSHTRHSHQLADK